VHEEKKKKRQALFPPPLTRTDRHSSEVVSCFRKNKKSTVSLSRFSWKADKLLNSSEECEHSPGNFGSDTRSAVIQWKQHASRVKLRSAAVHVLLATNHTPFWGAGKEERKEPHFTLHRECREKRSSLSRDRCVTNVVLSPESLVISSLAVPDAHDNIKSFPFLRGEVKKKKKEMPIFWIGHPPPFSTTPFPFLSKHGLGSAHRALSHIAPEPRPTSAHKTFSFRVNPSLVSWLLSPRSALARPPHTFTRALRWKVAEGR